MRTFTSKAAAIAAANASGFTERKSTGAAGNFGASSRIWLQKPGAPQVAPPGTVACVTKLSSGKWALLGGGAS